MLIQVITNTGRPSPRRLFYSYAHKDEALRSKLDEHLSCLKQEGFISVWHDRMIRPGDDFDRKISNELEVADIVLFLLSPSFLASSYCRDIEVKRAMERWAAGEAVVIPVILSACVYSREPFSKIQPIPRDGLPLNEQPDAGFARLAEELRVQVYEMSSPRRPRGDTTGLHGHWVLTVDGGGELISAEAQTRLVHTLQQLTKDYTIMVSGLARGQVIGGQSSGQQLTLLLDGSPEAFVTLRAAYEEGRLSTLLGVGVTAFYVGYGATTVGQSAPTGTGSLAVDDPSDLRLRPGTRANPSLMKGITIDQQNPTSMNFIFDKGDNPGEAVALAALQRHMDYFKVALGVKEENFWVNLSAYETDRMLPNVLAGTRLGRDMLAQDCILKRLTASLMHPDSATGRQYWDAAYERARKLFGTSQVPINTFQKVWIIPKKVVVYYDEDGPTDDLRERFHMKSEEQLAYIVESELDVLCDIDLLAMKNNPSATGEEQANFTLDIFKEIIVPALYREVNEGAHFAPIRQIYHALAISHWYRRYLRSNPKFASIFRDVDSDNPEAFLMTIRGVASLDAPRVQPQANMHSEDPEPVDHRLPDAPAFAIADNREFYRKYIRYFREGVFRCVRAESGDAPETIVNRAYFSGAIAFDGIGIVTARTHCLHHADATKFP